MKTFVFVVVVMSVMMVVYGLNMKRLKNYYNNIHECIKEKGGTLEKPSVEAVACTMEKDGGIYNANGEYVREYALKGIEDAISDPNTIQKAKEMYNKCHDEAERSKVTGHDQAIQMSGCTIPVIALFDKI